jgi:hypothetical protein
MERGNKGKGVGSPPPTLMSGEEAQSAEALETFDLVLLPQSSPATVELLDLVLAPPPPQSSNPPVEPAGELDLLLLLPPGAPQSSKSTSVEDVLRLELELPPPQSSNSPEALGLFPPPLPDQSSFRDLFATGSKLGLSPPPLGLHC